MASAGSVVTEDGARTGQGSTAPRPDGTAGNPPRRGDRGGSATFYRPPSVTGGGGVSTPTRSGAPAPPGVARRTTGTPRRAGCFRGASLPPSQQSASAAACRTRTAPRRARSAPDPLPLAAPPPACVGAPLRPAGPRPRSARLPAGPGPQRASAPRVPPAPPACAGRHVRGPSQPGPGSAPPVAVASVRATGRAVPPPCPWSKANRDGRGDVKDVPTPPIPRQAGRSAVPSPPAVTGSPRRGVDQPPLRSHGLGRSHLPRPSLPHCHGLPRSRCFRISSIHRSTNA